MCISIQELFRHLPQQRKLSKDSQAKAASLLGMRANKKLIQQELCQETGKIVLLKDLSNISSDSRKGKSRNDIDQVVKTLMEKYGKILYL